MFWYVCKCGQACASQRVTSRSWHCAPVPTTAPGAKMVLAQDCQAQSNKHADLSNYNENYMQLCYGDYFCYHHRSRNNRFLYAITMTIQQQYHPHVTIPRHPRRRPAEDHVVEIEMGRLARASFDDWNVENHEGHICFLRFLKPYKHHKIWDCMRYHRQI